MGIFGSQTKPTLTTALCQTLQNCWRLIVLVFSDRLNLTTQIPVVCGARSLRSHEIPGGRPHPLPAQPLPASALSVKAM